MIHLFERDCSVQRRHQKVVEIAPAPNLDRPSCATGCAPTRSASPREIGYRNAGTVEFLLDPDGQLRLHRDEPPHPGRAHGDRGGHRRRPRPGADADRGRARRSPTSGLAQDTRPAPRRGAAVPDHHRGPRQRLPARHRHDHDVPLPRRRRASASTAARRTPAPRSPPTSTRCWPSSPAAAATFDKAVERARRAVAEFRIRGVSTNIPFLQAVLDDPDFRPAACTTVVHRGPPAAAHRPRPARDRGTKLLTYLADVTVNQPHGPAPTSARPGRASCPTARPLRAGARRLAPAAARARARGVRPALREQTAGRGHRHHVPRRPPVAARHPGAHPRPARGRRPRGPDDPAAVVGRGLGRGDVRRGAALPRRGPVGAAGRAARGGAEPLPADAAARAQHGRLHAVPDRGDRAPSCRRPRPPASTCSGSSTPSTTSSRCGRRSRRSARPGRTVAEVALCYTGDLSDPDETLYTLDYYLRPRRRGSSTPGRTCWRSRTWPGCCARPRPAPWSPRCASGSTCRCTCTPTTPPVASWPPCSRRSTPASTPSTPPRPRWPAPPRSRRCPRWSRRPTTPSARPGCRSTRSARSSPTGRPPAGSTRPFESGLPSPTGRVYRHEIPGGQLSNLRQQAIALGLGEKFEQIEDMYAAANDILGNVVKVTPSSKVVGDLALHLVAVGADPAEFAEDPARFDIPDSVIGFLDGELGDPPGGWPEPFRTKALEGRTGQARPRPSSAPSSATGCASARGADAQPAAVPRPHQRLHRGSREKYGDISVLPTDRLPLRPARTARSTRSSSSEGKTVLFGLQAISEPDERGFRTVMAPSTASCGPISVRDRSVAADVAAAEKADPATRPRRRAVPGRGHDRRRRGRRGRGRRRRSPPSRR